MNENEKSRKINQFYWKYIAQEKNFQFNLISNVYVLKTFDNNKKNYSDNLFFIFNLYISFNITYGHTYVYVYNYIYIYAYIYIYILIIINYVYIM